MRMYSCTCRYREEWNDGSYFTWKSEATTQFRICMAPFYSICHKGGTRVYLSRLNASEVLKLPVNPELLPNQCNTMIHDLELGQLFITNR